MCVGVGIFSTHARLVVEFGLWISGKSSLLITQLFLGEFLQRQASVFTPSIFMAQLPQIPSRQLLRNVNVGSTSFLILIKASNIIGPVLLRSSVYDCIFGFSCGLSGDHRYMWKVFILESLSSTGSLMVEVLLGGSGG